MATETYNQLRTWIDSIFNKNGRKFISGLLGNEGLKRVLAKAEELFNSLGIANGIATLGDDGKVPETQLPSYVDDVLEFTDFASFPATGETGKIYLDTSENTTYRWTGTTYIQIGSGNDGEANTASNVGTSGVGIFKQKSGVDLEFKKLLAGDNITLTATANDEIEVKADGGGVVSNFLLQLSTNPTYNSDNTIKILKQEYISDPTKYFEQRFEYTDGVVTKIEIKDDMTSEFIQKTNLFSNGLLVKPTITDITTWTIT